MTFINFKLKITDPNIIIEKRLKIAIADKINLAIDIAAKKVRSRIKPIIDQAINDSHEVASLFGGELQAELGVDTATASIAINDIIDKLVNSIVVEVKHFSIFGGVMRGHIVVSVFPKDFVDNVLKGAYATYLTKQNQPIPWLQWWLTLGDQIIIRRYIVDYSRSKGSRTGLATMKKVKKGGWRVPPQYSGTKTRNFITRALEDISDLICYYIKLEFVRAL